MRVNDARQHTYHGKYIGSLIGDIVELLRSFSAFRVARNNVFWYANKLFFGE